MTFKSLLTSRTQLSLELLVSALLHRHLCESCHPLLCEWCANGAIGTMEKSPSCAGSQASSSYEETPHYCWSCGGFQIHWTVLAGWSSSRIFSCTSREIPTSACDRSFQPFWTGCLVLFAVAEGWFRFPATVVVQSTSRATVLQLGGYRTRRQGCTLKLTPKIILITVVDLNNYDNIFSRHNNQVPFY